VRTAPTPVLTRSTVAAARNARSLVEDAELLTAAGRPARAYALAVLAVEEVGKAGSLATLAAMPEQLRSQAPVGRMLEWHQLKLVGGMLIAALPFAPVPFAPPVLGTKLATTPVDELAQLLDNAQAAAQQLDNIKQRGLYADVDRSGQVREPEELAASQIREQLGQAQQAASSANALLRPGAQEVIASPGPESVEYSRALVSAFAQAGHGRSPQAAADVLLNAVANLQGRTPTER
jgi:AbiV family abortive infection protein